MKRTMIIAALSVSAMALVLVPVAKAEIAASDVNWSVAHGLSTPSPADNRSVAVDPTGQFLYLGYNNPSSGFAVRKVELSSGNVLGSIAQRGKSIAVDDQGRVYTTGVNGESVFVYDANLNFQYEITQPTKTEGIALRREGGVLALYATDRTDHTLTRFALSEAAGAITGHTVAGLDGDGVISIGSDLRGVGLAPDGNIWLADPQSSLTSGRVYKLDSAGTVLGLVAMTNPYYFAFSGDQVLVTQAYAGRVDVLNASDASLALSLTPTWSAMNLATYQGYANGDAISGIAMAPNGSGFYVTYEHGHSATGATPYLFEPVLFATVPEPATLSLLALSGMALIRRRRSA